jgi:hypothetical protein
MGQMSIAENALLLVTFAIGRSINNGPRAPAGQGGVPTMTGGTALTWGLSPPRPVPVAREGHGISERRACSILGVDRSAVRYAHWRGCGGCSGQQDGPDRLGYDVERRSLSRDSAPRGGLIRLVMAGARAHADDDRSIRQSAKCRVSSRRINVDGTFGGWLRFPSWASGRRPHAKAGHTTAIDSHLSARTSCIHGAVHTRRHAAPPNRETPPRSAWRKPRTLLLSGGLGLRSRHPNLRCLAVWTLWGSRVARAVWTLWGNPHRIIHRKYWTVWGSSLDSFGTLQQVVVSAINMLGQLSPGLCRDKL